ncbi:MAG TPA: serine/threonine-protein kinase, partial [Solirubrobacteraceae bacterium]|nr:serine/threonine-protein kinase [Solirubrobacteraceae bacterium]
PWWAEQAEWVERFEREAQLLARVSDPGIVQIFDIGHAAEGPYYVAELVDGESLAQRLQRGAMTPSEAVAIATRLCDALASAHMRGIVHCDVKPANVLLSGDGALKVGDFGVARLAGDGTSQALSATVAGTPRYMAPEQARGQRTTPATDVYSAGVVLYEMLAGAAPFVQGSPVALGLRHVQDEPPPLPAGVPSRLHKIVARALAKEPERRYADGAQMAAALRAAELGRAASESESATQPVADASMLDAQMADAQMSGTPANDTPTQALQRTRLMPRAPSVASASSRASDPDAIATERRAPRGVDVHAGTWRRRGWLALALIALAIAAVVVWLASSGGGSPARVRVPRLIGQPAPAARSALAAAGLRATSRLVGAPGATPGDVTSQAPAPGISVQRGRHVVLSVAEQPRWRTLTTFSGTGGGHSVPFQIDGRRWRVEYSMSYEGSCLLLVVCFGPSAHTTNLHSGESLEAFDLSSGTAHGHTFGSGPGLYEMTVAPGHDAARWSMTVQDYY